MDLDEKIYAHILSVWKEPKEFFGGRSLEGMLILTDKHLMFVRKTEAKMRWWGAVTQRQVIKFIRSKDVMITQDGYTEESLRTDLENKKNQEVRFDDILYIEFQEKVWGSALLMEIIENGDKKKYQFSVVNASNTCTFIFDVSNPFCFRYFAISDGIKCFSGSLGHGLGINITLYPSTSAF